LVLFHIIYILSNILKFKEGNGNLKLNERVENYKYFSSSLIFLILSNVFSILIRMGSRIIIARFSTVDLYGLYSVIWNEMTFVSTFALLGLGQQLTINLPRKNREEKIQSITSTIIYSSIISIITLVISIILYSLQVDSSYKYSTLISAFFTLFLFIQFILIGLKDFLGYFIQTAIQSISLFIMIIIFRNFLSIDLLVYFTFGSILLSILITVIYKIIRSKFAIRKISFANIKIFDFSKKRINLFIVDIVNSIIIYLLLKLPQIIVNNSLAGFINIAFSVISFIIIIPQMISVSLGPKISKDHFDNEHSKLHYSFRISLSLLYIFQGIVIIAFSYFGDFFIELLYGKEYVIGSGLIFYGFILSVIIDSLNYPYALYLRNTDHEGLFAIGKIISLLTFVIPEVILLYTLKYYLELAVPIAYLISTVSLLSFYFFYTMKLNIKFDKKDTRNILLWLLFMFTSASIAFTLNHFIVNKIYLLLIMLLNLVLFFGYLLINRTLKPKSLISDIKEMISLKAKNNEQIRIE